MEPGASTGRRLQSLTGRWAMSGHLGQLVTGDGVAEIRVEITTGMSVRECASTFESAVRANYGVGRKLLRGFSAIRNNGAGEGGLEFFTPDDGPGDRPDHKAGALVPGYNQLHGASQMAVHIYVKDRGAHREVHLVGPGRMGDGGSTKRLVNGIATHFR